MRARGGRGLGHSGIEPGVASRRDEESEAAGQEAGAKSTQVYWLDYIYVENWELYYWNLRMYVCMGP